MKLLLPSALALLLTACATPEDKGVAHQRQLEKEARENFMALKGRSGTSTPRPVQIARAQPAAPTKSFFQTFRGKPVRRANDTVYFWDVPRRPVTESGLYHAYLQQYAHELAKRPEDLAPEEREWVRRHYQDRRFNRAL